MLPSHLSLQRETIHIHLSSQVANAPLAQRSRQRKTENRSTVCHAQYLCLWVSHCSFIFYFFWPLIAKIILPAGPSFLKSFPSSWVEIIHTLLSSPKHHALAMGWRKAWILAASDMVKILALPFKTMWCWAHDLISLKSNFLICQIIYGTAGMSSWAEIHQSAHDNAWHIIVLGQCWLRQERGIGRDMHLPATKSHTGEMCWHYYRYI